MTSTEMDVAYLAAEDMKPSCEWGAKMSLTASTGQQPQCPTPAAWVATMHPCLANEQRHPRYLLFCDNHRRWLDTLPWMTCRPCQFRYRFSEFFTSWVAL